MECGMVGYPTRLRTFNLNTRHLPTLEWPSLEQPGSALTASTPVLGVSSPASTNGYGLLCGLWVWRRRTNRRPCCPPLSIPSTSSWTAQPEGSGRWVNRMAAQHLPRDLVQPSSGQKNWLKRRRRSFELGLRSRLGKGKYLVNHSRFACFTTFSVECFKSELWACLKLIALYPDFDVDAHFYLCVYYLCIST